MIYLFYYIIIIVFLQLSFIVAADSFYVALFQWSLT